MDIHRPRWSDQQKLLGPFLYSRDKGSAHSLTLSSGDDDYPGNSARLTLFGHTFIVYLPSILKPAGKYGEHERVYGIAQHDGSIWIYYGQQTHDSSTDKLWSWSMPWANWRFIEARYYGVDGRWLMTEPAYRAPGTFSLWYKRVQSVPTVKFNFRDFDDEGIMATTRIEEREWRFGTRWCSWLSWFVPKKVRRSLHIDFSKEVGKRKGSWKGGTLGHGIDMKEGELHEEAFLRYCDEHALTFVARHPTT